MSIGRSLRRLISAAIVAVFAATLMPASALAGGLSQFPIDVSVSASSASANGTSKITFSVYIYGYYCSNGYGGGTTGEAPETCPDGSASTKKGQAREIGIYPSGSGNVLGGTTDKGGGVYAVQADANGNAQFTLASTVAEAKTVKFTDAARSAPYAGAPSQSVTFTAVAAAAPKKTTTPTPAPVVVQPPEAPKASALTIAGQPVTDGQNISFTTTQSLTLQGTTVPNGIVKLYIFSTPREATVTADSAGVWTYKVSGLEAGEHHVEAAVTDPATSQTSDRATLASFTVRMAAKTTVAIQTSAKKSQTGLWAAISLGVLVLVAGAAGVWWHLKRKKRVGAITVPPANGTQTEDPHADPPRDNTSSLG